MQQRVDPFIPVHMQHSTPPARPAAAVRPPMPAKRPLGGVDGFVRSHTAASSSPPQPAAVPARIPVPAAVVTVTPVLTPALAPAVGPATAMPLSPPMRSVRPAKSEHAKRHRLRSAFGTVGFVVAVLAAGIIAQTLLAGEILIAAYAVYALVRRVPSRTTFTLALLSLVLILVLQAFGRDKLVASNFAVYSLLLAFVGVVTLAREVRQPRA